MKKFWFPTLILIVLMASFVASLWWALESPTSRYDDNMAQWILTLLVGICAIAFMIIWPCTYGGSIAKMAGLEAFFKKTKEVYELVAKATQEVEIKAVKELPTGTTGSNEIVKLGNLAYNQLGQTASERLSELREAVESYNSQLTEYQRLNEYWASRGFIPNVPSDLEIMSVNDISVS